MYTEYYHLDADPFRLSPDPRFCFGHKSYQKSRAYMRYAIERGEGFAMITGSPGTGKTMLSHDLISSLDKDRVAVAQLVSTRLAADDLLRMVAYSFGLHVEGADKATVIRRLEKFLEQANVAGRRAVIIVDEAQDLTENALEELRLLTNLQVAGRYLVQVVLLGQDTLRDVVRAPAMEQLHQRFIAASHLEPMAANEARDYVLHRLNCAGWKGDPAIEQEAFLAIYELSQGVPRRVNLVCSRLLLHGCSLEKHALTRDDVVMVSRELSAETLSSADDPLTEELSADFAEFQQNLTAQGADRGRSTSVPGLDDAPTRPYQQVTETVPPATAEARDWRAAHAAETESDLPSFNALRPAANAHHRSTALPAADLATDGTLTENKRKRLGQGFAVAALALAALLIALYLIDPRVIGPIAVDLKAWLMGKSSSTDIPPRDGEQGDQVASSGATGNLVAGAGPGHDPRRPAPTSRAIDSQTGAPTLPPAERRTDGVANPAARSVSTTMPQGGAQNAKYSDPETLSGGTEPIAGQEGRGRRPEATARPIEAVSGAGRAPLPGEATDGAPFAPADTAGRPEATEFVSWLQSRGFRAVYDPELQRMLARVGPVTRQADDTLQLVLEETTGFDTNSTDIPPPLQPTLNRLASVLRERTNTFVGIVGHTDSTGDKPVNLLVSRERADAVAEYLIRAGIRRGRLYSAGKGSNQPRASNATPAGRQLNRRVEIFVAAIG